MSLCGLPPTAGVYAIYTLNRDTKESQLQYIGSSKNMANRVYKNKHKYIDLFNKKMDNEYVCVAFLETEDYVSIEKKLIKTHNPLLNIIHRNHHG